MGSTNTAAGEGQTNVDAWQNGVGDTEREGRACAQPQYAIEEDDVARSLPAGRGGVPKPAVVTFIGWVKSEGEDTFCLVDDSYCETWVEIPKDKVVHQVPGSQRPNDEGRSVVWVQADALVIRWRRRTATASVVAEADGFAFADPAGGYGGGSGTHKP